tara:strand:+ start:477 stop:1847 length:1371 start_codon:yes stop_codon:yes gene_type:complete
MGADQSLISAVKSMGPSRFRNDSGWLKALSAIGKYTAVKRKQFQQSTENFTGAVEDVDIDGLVQYKEEVDGLLKTMKNVPAFLPKYKKAANRYNEIMSNIEGTKTLLSSLAQKKVTLGTNSSNLSKYQNPSEVALDADVMSQKYTTKMSDNGPLMVFESGQEILVSDYVAKNPILISDSKASNDKINNTIEKYGSQAKINNEKYAAETVKSQVSKDVDEMWVNGNDPTTILYNTNYETKDGTTTFMNYLAKTDPNYMDSLRKIEQEGRDSKGPFFDWGKYDIPSDSYIQEQTNILQIGLWKEGDQESIKQKYKEFLQNEVINHQYQVNSGKKYNSQGKLISDASVYMGMSKYSNSQLYVNEQVVRTKAQNLLNAKLGDIENWYEGDDIRYKAVYMVRPGTDGGVMKDANNKPIIGWQEIDKDGNPVGDVMSIDYTVKNTFNIVNPDLRTKRVVNLP